ncbi:MAG: hypothetical protein AAFR14_10340, partial [Bacteroidota bacterium]
MNVLLKKYGLDLIIVVSFVFVCMLRFTPQLQGKVVTQSDVVQAEAMQKEAQDYNRTHDDVTYWTNNMFGGMPTYAIWAPTFNPIAIPMKFMQLGFKGPIGMVFMAMLCMFLLLRLMTIPSWLAGFIAIAFGLCTNHMILWEAGHTNKLLTVANASLVIAAMFLAFEKRTLIPALLTMAFGLALNIKSGHIQMTYYLFLAVLVMGICYGIEAIRKRELVPFVRQSGALLGGAIIAVLLCWNSLSIQNSFKKDTMRGVPILESKSTEDASSSSETEGLAWNYAMQWSNGPLDMLAMLVPRAAGGGGAEKPVKNSKMLRSLRERGVNTRDMRLPYYFGDLPVTSGGIYFGVSLFFFFLLSCFQLRGPLQWWLIGSFVLLSLLAMGKNAAWFNLPFYKIFPLYNSFRAPSSITTISILPVIIGAALGVKQVVDSEWKEYRRALLLSSIVLSVICLFVGFLLPSMSDLAGASDARLQTMGFDPELLRQDRAIALRNDSIRSLLF